MNLDPTTNPTPEASTPKSEVTPETKPARRPRGFAAMDRSKVSEIASKGGKAAHAAGTAHQFTADEARAAGRKGGERVSADRSHMSRIGRLGGKTSAGRRQTGSSDASSDGNADKAGQTENAPVESGSAAGGGAEAQYGTPHGATTAGEAGERGNPG